MVIERVEGRSFFQQILRIFTRAKDAINKSNFDFAGLKPLLNKIDIFLVAAGVLNFAPAKPDLAIDSGKQRLLALRLGWLRDIFCDQLLGVIRSIPFGSFVALSFKISPPNGFGVFL